MENKVILILISRYYPFCGGNILQCKQLTEELIASGHKTIVLTRRPLKYIDMPSYVLSIPWLFLSHKNKYIRGINSFLFSMASVAYIIYLLLVYKYNIKMILVHGQYYGCGLINVIKPIYSGKIILKTMAEGSFIKNGTLNRLNQWLLRRFDNIIAISRRIDKEWQTALGGKGRVAFIPDGINLEQFKRYKNTKEDSEYINDDQHNIILYAGHIVPVKRIEDIIDALNIVRNQSVHFRCIFVGRQQGIHDDYYNLLLDKINKYKLQEEILFIDWKDNVVDYYHSATIFVISSAAEGLSNVMLEAMASGLPVISTKISGSEDVIIDGINGRLFKVGDYNRLAELIMDLFNNPGLRKSLSAKAQETVSNQYSLQQQISKMKGVLLSEQ